MPAGKGREQEAAHQGAERRLLGEANRLAEALDQSWQEEARTVQSRDELVEQVQGLHEKVLARTPAGRWGAPEDMAGIAVFLASRASDFITGTAIPVDGGYAAQG